MPLPPSPVARTRLHTRRIVCEGFQRTDGLFDIEARLTDVKDDDLPLKSGVRPAGEAIHDMSVRVTIDEHLQIHDLQAVSDAVPYPNGCELIPPSYRQLIGRNLAKGFREALRQLVGGVHGCTHLTEILGCLPTAAVQTFASLHYAKAGAGGAKPFQLDRCHALETHTDTVRRYYPKWYRGAA